jgi:GAF domain-containing protein
MTIFREWWASVRATKKPDYLGFRGLSLWPFNLDSQETPRRLSAFSRSGLEPLESLPPANVELLQMVNRMLSTDTNRSDVLRSTLYLTLESMGAESGSLVLLDEAGDVAEGCVLQEGQAQALEATQLTDVVEQGLAGWVMKTRRPALVESTRDDPRWLLRDWEESDQNIDRSALGVPVIVSERLVGVMTLVRPQPQQFTEEDLELVAKHAVTA